MDSVRSKVLLRIKSKKRGWVFTTADFLDVGSRSAVDQALSRLAASEVRRLARGFYDVPTISKYTGNVAPADPQQIMKAIARRDGIKILSDNVVHANGLGFTNAVPAKLIYLTDGPTKSLKIGCWTLRMKHVSPEFMRNATSKSGSLFQALTWLGEGVSNIEDLLTANVSEDLLNDAIKNMNHYPAWMSEVINNSKKHRK